MQRFACTLLGLCLLAPSVQAQPSAGGGIHSPLLDLIEVSVLGRELVAFGSAGGELRERLHIGEQVRWTGNRGAVGAVITDQRVLFVGTGSATWQERRYERGETSPDSAQLGERVALATTRRRALGFDADGNTLLEYRLGPHEDLRAAVVGAQVAVVVTSRNALGLSPRSAGFQSRDLRVNERVEGVDAGSSVATLRTSERVLVFRSGTGSWGERRREIHDR